jgi:hypothetical protein
VSEVILGEVEEIGFPGVTRARTSVDRDPEPLATPFEEDLIVRTLAPGLRLPVDDSAAEEAVAPDSHDDFPSTNNDGRGKSITRPSFCPTSQ